MVQEPSFSSARPFVARKTTTSIQTDKQGNSIAREEHSRNEAQDHRERLLLTELGDTSKLVTDLTHSRHQNFHIRQSVAGSAVPSAGALRKVPSAMVFLV